MERERRAWNDHKELRLSDERAKFEEEKAFLIQDFQYKLHLERERYQQLELVTLSTMKSVRKHCRFIFQQLKESDRERTNAIYQIKVQYRQEYENEIIRLNEQYQTVCKRRKL